MATERADDGAADDDDVGAVGRFHARMLAASAGRARGRAFHDRRGQPLDSREMAPAKPVILTVDDDVPVLRAIERDLRARYGKEHRVVAASSGAEALEAVRQLTSAAA